MLSSSFRCDLINNCGIKKLQSFSVQALPLLHSSWTCAGQQCDQNTSKTIMNFVTLCSVTFDDQYSEASLLNNGSCLASALVVTKLINTRYIILVTLCCTT
jgi:hypothetical protein